LNDSWVSACQGPTPHHIPERCHEKKGKKQDRETASVPPDEIACDCQHKRDRYFGNGSGNDSPQCLVKRHRRVDECDSVGIAMD
jgi:hypothetical protein